MPLTEYSASLKPPFQSRPTPKLSPLKKICLSSSRFSPDHLKGQVLPFSWDGQILIRQHHDYKEIIHIEKHRKCDRESGNPLHYINSCRRLGVKTHYHWLHIFLKEITQMRNIPWGGDTQYKPYISKPTFVIKMSLEKLQLHEMLLKSTFFHSIQAIWEPQW